MEERERVNRTMSNRLMSLEKFLWEEIHARNIYIWPKNIGINTDSENASDITSIDQTGQPYPRDKDKAHKTVLSVIDDVATPTTTATATHTVTIKPVTTTNASNTSNINTISGSAGNATPEKSSSNNVHLHNAGGGEHHHDTKRSVHFESSAGNSTNTPATPHDDADVSSYHYPHHGHHHHPRQQ